MTGHNEYVFIEDGFRCSFGKNIRFHGMAMINYDCTFLDTNFIDIGSCALIGPACKLICTNHSIDPDERLKGVFYMAGISDRHDVCGNILRDDRACGLLHPSPLYLEL